MIKLKQLIKEFSDDDDTVILPGIEGVIKMKGGWLTNREEFFGVSQFGHILALKNLPLSDSLKARIGADLTELVDSYESCKALEDAEGSVNAEWHTYEMTHDEVGGRIISGVYGEGWIRIGKAHSQALWEFEGTSEALKSHIDCIRKFKNQLEEPDSEIKFRPTI
jgi:hypothetical protein